MEGTLAWPLDRCYSSTVLDQESWRLLLRRLSGVGGLVLGPASRTLACWPSVGATADTSSPREPPVGGCYSECTGIWPRKQRDPGPGVARISVLIQVRSSTCMSSQLHRQSKCSSHIFIWALIWAPWHDPRPYVFIRVPRRRPAS